MSEAPETPEMRHQRIDVEISKMLTEISKISAETSRINQQIRQDEKTCPWLPLAVAIVPAILGSTGVIGAIIALVVAFHR